MHGSTLKAFGLTLAVLVGATVAVFAQSAPPAPAPQAGAETAPAPGGAMSACRADVKALCANAPAGRGGKMQCLVENRAKASPECQAAMTAIEQRSAQRGGGKGEKRARFAACQSDIANLCPEAAKGGGRAQCLKQNEAKLSPECGAAVKQIREARQQGAKQAREACKTDVQTLCGSVEKGRGAAMQCLRQNEAKVSPPCAQALAVLPLRKRQQMEPAASPGVVPPATQSAPAMPKPQ
jgi:hypothetical protein